MDLNEYQRRAVATDQHPESDGAGLVIALLGLAGEAGELLTEYKKRLRDGAAHRLFRERVGEELGDLLWYVASVARKFGLDLADIAERNLEKNGERWGERAFRPEHPAYDVGYPEGERLPRQMQVEIRDELDGARVRMVAFANGRPLGDPLTDNAFANDGYRFHDVFHLAYAAVLGWSPVVRKNLKLKRKSNAAVDEVEDGGRAALVEEGISALAFAYARDHDWLAGVEELDYGLLRTIKGMVAHLEVRDRTLGEWERAILDGFRVWREVFENGGGVVAVDLDAGVIAYIGPPESTAAPATPGS